MPINPEAVGVTTAPVDTTWDSKDSLLYALAVGCGVNDLQYTTENSMNITQRAVPTMAVTLADATGALLHIGPFNFALLVHGEQRVHLHRELPTQGTATTVVEITGIFDKGKGALVELTSRSVDTTSGEPLFDHVMSVFLRGEGGWGGNRGPSGTGGVAPDRSADQVVTYQTSVDQALLYRLTGDRNPLHSDPSFAAMAGFDRPILHGMCTYGFTCRALLAACCDDDPSAFESMQARFSSPVFPGEALTIETWRVSDSESVFRTLGDDGRVVIDNGLFTRRT